MTEAVADALQRAELRLMERAELGVASESSMGALGSMAASMAEVGDVMRVMWSGQIIATSHDLTPNGRVVG